MSCRRITPPLAIALFATCSDSTLPPPTEHQLPPPPQVSNTDDPNHNPNATSNPQQKTIEDPQDPPSPAGNIKQEIEAFTTLDECVDTRQQLDPVVGDAIDALGYDTLQRDACRILEAAHKQNTTICDSILATALQIHCLSTVAITKGDPLACPMRSTNHDPTCIAMALRDHRLCQATSLMEQPTCIAVIKQDPSICMDDTQCQRRVARWSGFLQNPIERPNVATNATIEIVELVDGKVGPKQSLDLTPIIRGAAVRTTAQGIQIELGDHSSAAWPPAAILTSPRMSVRIQLDAKTSVHGEHAPANGSVLIELLVPGGTLITSAKSSRSAKLKVDTIGLEFGAPVRFALEIDVGPPKQGHRLRMTVSTMVVDVVK